MPSKDKNNQGNKDSFWEQGFNATQHNRKESKAKRKLEVNAQPGKLRVWPRNVSSCRFIRGFFYV